MVVGTLFHRYLEYIRLHIGYKLNPLLGDGIRQPSNFDRQSFLCQCPSHIPLHMLCISLHSNMSNILYCTCDNVPCPNNIHQHIQHILTMSCSNILFQELLVVDTMTCILSYNSHLDTSYIIRCQDMSHILLDIIHRLLSFGNIHHYRMHILLHLAATFDNLVKHR